MNIVMVMSDDQRFDAVSKMPFVNGRTDWVRFKQAIWNNPLCCPSRASILSGLYSHHTHVENNTQGDLFDDSNTLATWLHDGGYRTGFFGKYVNGYRSRRTRTSRRAGIVGSRSTISRRSTTTTSSTRPRSSTTGRTPTTIRRMCSPIEP